MRSRRKTDKVERMDFESLKKYALSIHKMAQEGPDLYFCRPYIEGPAYSYPEITDVLLNFVFCELKSGWVFMTNATGLSVSSPVSLYCSSSIMYSSPLQPEIKRVLRHFSLLLPNLASITRAILQCTMQMVLC